MTYLFESAWRVALLADLALWVGCEIDTPVWLSDLLTHNSLFVSARAKNNQSIQLQQHNGEKNYKDKDN